MRSEIEEAAFRVLQHRNMMEYEMANLVKALEDRYETDRVLDIYAFRARQEELKEKIELDESINLRASQELEAMKMELKAMEEIYGTNP